jgi:hypothetical protein
VKVAGQDVIAAHDNLAHAARRQAGRRKLRSGIWSDRRAPLIPQNSELDSRHRKAGEQASPGDHGGQVFDAHRMA